MANRKWGEVDPFLSSNIGGRSRPTKLAINIYHSRFNLYHRRVVTQPRTLFIINNAAAKARGSWPIVRKQFEASGTDFDFYETTQTGDATIRTRAALRAGITTIAIVGGDGTLSETAAGFFEVGNERKTWPLPINSKAALAILPAGTGDDFVRSLMGDARLSSTGSICWSPIVREGLSRARDWLM